MDRIGRQEIVTALEEVATQSASVLAAWEAGSESFGRVDDYSDIDLVLVVEPDAVESSLVGVEQALERLSPLEATFRLAEPTWHGHAQVFHRLRDASPDHFVDLVVMREDASDFFLQPEVHGHPRIIIDRRGIKAPPPLDKGELSQSNAARIERIRARHRILGGIPAKELRRGRPLDAMSFFHSLTLRHLIERLRIEHDPARPSFGFRYCEHDLPRAVHDRLERLLFVGDATALGQAISEANEWLDELLV